MGGGEDDDEVEMHQIVNVNIYLDNSNMST